MQKKNPNSFLVARQHNKMTIENTLFMNKYIRFSKNYLLNILDLFWAI